MSLTSYQPDEVSFTVNGQRIVCFARLPARPIRPGLAPRRAADLYGVTTWLSLDIARMRELRDRWRQRYYDVQWLAHRRPRVELPPPRLGACDSDLPPIQWLQNGR